MPFRVKILVVGLLIVVAAVVAFLLLPTTSQPRATLLFNGYRTDTNQVKRASFTLTNSAPIGIGYRVMKESGGSNTFVFTGSLHTRGVVRVDVPVSQTPARLMIHCSTRGRLRDALVDLRGMFGLKPSTPSTEYTLISPPVRE
jgi:hypothetical protein